MVPPTRSSWRTWEIRDGRLLINGETPCDVVTTTVIRGVHDKGRFVLVPKAAEWEPPAADAAPRLAVRFFVDGTDHVFARRGRLWIVHEAVHRPGTEGGVGPAYVNGTARIPEWEGNATKPFECLDPPLPAAGEHLFWFAKPKGRGTIRVNEIPGPENDHVLSLTIEDAAPGAQWYEIVVAAWAPPPVALFERRITVQKVGGSNPLAPTKPPLPQIPLLTGLVASSSQPPAPPIVRSIVAPCAASVPLPGN